MKIFKPIPSQFQPRVSIDATIAVLANDGDPAPDKVDVEIVEMYEDDGWKAWQDSAFVEEFTNSALQTIPGR